MAFSSDDVRMGASAAALMVAYGMHTTIRNRVMQPGIEAGINAVKASKREEME